MMTSVDRTPYRGTEVSVDKSQAEMRRLLRKFDVEDLQFTFRASQGIQLVFAKPDQVGHFDTYRLRVQPLTNDDKGERQAMRMMYWWAKAKMETVEFGIADFETEWLPYRLVAGEKGPVTISERLLPQLKAGGTNVDPFKPALPAG